MITALLACASEAPLLLLLWFRKKKIHSQRGYLRANKERETSPLINQEALPSDSEDDAFHSPDEGNAWGYSTNSQRLPHFSDDSEEEEAFPPYHTPDSKGAGSSPFSLSPSSPSFSSPPLLQQQEGARSKLATEQPDGGWTSDDFDESAFRTPRGSFLSAKEEFMSPREGSPFPSRSPSPLPASASMPLREKGSAEGLLPRSYSSVPLGNTAPADEEKLDESGQMRRLLSLLKNAIGVKDMDSMRLQMPSWIHEGDSALQRSAAMTFPQLFSSMADGETPLQRMVLVTKYVLGNFHTQSSAKKKPFNPILGEQFVCHWPGTRVRYFSEQVSHHPPISTFHYEDPDQGVHYNGSSQAIMSFTGSAIKITFRGAHVITITHPKGSNVEKEDYSFTMPLYFLRGILVGNVWVDFNGELSISCPQTGCSAKISFPEKPLFGGQFRAVRGEIFDRSGNPRYEVTGTWDKMIKIRNLETSKEDVLIDVANERKTKPEPPPIEEQGEMESMRVWYDCSTAIKEEKWNRADQAKHVIEELQRRYHKDMEKGTVPNHSPVYFDPVDKDRLVFEFVGEEKAKLRKPWFSYYQQALSE